MDNKSQTLQSGLFAGLPSKSIRGYFVQVLSLPLGILVGYLIMYLAEVAFSVNLYQYSVSIGLASFLIVREVLAAINPKIFDLAVQRNRRDTLIVVGAYLLGMTTLILVQALFPLRGFWNFVIAVVLALIGIYLPCLLFGSSELKRAILSTRRENRTP